MTNENAVRNEEQRIAVISPDDEYYAICWDYDEEDEEDEKYCYYDDYEEEDEEDEEDEDYYQFSLIFFRNNMLFYEVKHNPKMRYFKSNRILIGDIDCGEDIEIHLKNINDYGVKKGITFAIYKTRNGLRFFDITNIYAGVNRTACNLLKDLNCDPIYIDFCRKLGYFAARLTPKVDDFDDYYQRLIYGLSEPVSVCNYLGLSGGEVSVNSIIISCLEHHNFITQANDFTLPLA